MVDIDVTDCGDGVPPEFQDQLFRESTRTGGSVFYSPSASGGACFTLVLPAV